MKAKKVKNVIPEPNGNSMLERIGLKDISLNITLADNAKEAVDDLRSTITDETKKTRHLIIWLAIIQATASVVSASIALVV